MEIKKYYYKIKDIIEKYEISLISSSTSFYMIVAIYSLLILFIQFYNYFSENSFIVNKLIEIINPYYIVTFEKLIPIFTINRYSPILLFNLIWSSSKFINGFNKVSDLIYKSHKRRNYFVNRLNSIIIFILILFTIFFELVTVFFANMIVKIFFDNIIIYMIFQFIIDIFIIFSIMLLMNIYIPPVKMNIKKVIKGSLFSTITIYILLVSFILIIYIIKYININFNIISLLSLFFILVYLINYCIVIGIYINYSLQYKPK